MSSLNLRAVEVFVCVCELGSLTRAAMALGLTQPSASRAISGLEEHLGGSLLLRTGRGVTPTELGQAALPRMQSLLTEAEALSTDLRDLGRSPTGMVTVGILPSLTQPLAGLLFDHLRRHFPRLQLRILEGFSPQIEEWLAAGRVDVGLLSHYRRSRSSQEEELLTERLMLVGPPDKRFPREAIPFHALAGLPLVLPARPNGLRVLVDETTARQGVSLDIVMEADCLGAQKDVIRHFGCFAILSPQAVQEALNLGQLRCTTIIEPELTRRAVLASTTHRPLSRGAREVMRAIREITDSLSIEA
nr:LysR family transcriptional regulator [Halomonas socia]